MKKLSLILLMSLALIACEEETDCAEEDKVVEYTVNDTYYYTTMDPKLICP